MKKKGTLKEEDVLHFSHEMSNLLVGIQGYARLLHQDGFVDKKGEDYLKKLTLLSDRATDASKVFQSLVKKTRGEVEAQSQRGSAPKGNQSPIKKNSYRVLIVDDEPAVCEIAATHLVCAGCEVTIATDGHSALRIFETTSFDCVLLDLTMPIMSGNLVFARLKAIDPNVPIVLMSSYITEERLKDFSQVGFFCFVEKPFNSEDLVARILSACQTKRRSTKLVENL